MTRETYLMKNPVLQVKLGETVSNPSGNVLQEVADQEMLAGAHPATGTVSTFCGVIISVFLGNKGKYCTLTVECMPSCNAATDLMPE